MSRGYRRFDPLKRDARYRRMLTDAGLELCAPVPG